MILDTNALSAWAEGDPALLASLRSDRPWYLPSIVLGEFRFGILGSNQRDHLEAWLDTIESVCTILSVDEETARLYGELRRKLTTVGISMPYHDIWIGALAVQHNQPVLTRDAHFRSIPGVTAVSW